MWGKVQTVGTITEFINKEATLGMTASLNGLLDWALHPVGQTKEFGANLAYEKIEPFLDILCIISYPIASILITTAGLLYIINLKEKSISWLTKTTLIYVLIQLLPTLTKMTIQLLASY
ncbi:hypothetical protein [Priestia flexa]|uniref:hypothetical protein n=1 Tax=Priestia flexa TaxID=86664 RepID=UPI001CFE7BEC|nr:hypothetical protein [Priestia flexa]